MQELRRNHPNWLEQRVISFADGYAGRYVSNTLVISHRWEDPLAPDGKGVKFKATKEHLLANQAIKWVRYDSGRCRRARTRLKSRTSSSR